MIPLNEVQIQILRERLRIMRHDLLSLIERQRKHQGGMTAGRVNVGDGSKLVLIEAALQRIEIGQFGGCTDCDRRIGMRMLVDDPCAIYCRTCAKAREQATISAQMPGPGTWAQ